MTKNNGNVIWRNVLSTIGLGIILLGIFATVLESNLSTKYQFKILRKDINQMDINVNSKIDLKSSDRWRKKNDKLFMTEYSRTNNLKMIPHECIVE